MPKDDKHTKRQNENSVGSPMPQNSKTSAKKQITFRADGKKKKPLYYEAFEGILKVGVAVLFLFVMFSLFSLFINLFSLVYVRIIATVVSSIPIGFVKVVKIMSKHKKINDEVKALAEMLSAIGSFIKQKCKDSFLIKALCLMIVIPLLLALVLSSSSDVSALTTAKVNAVWESMQGWKETLSSSEEEPKKDEVMFYSPEMTFIITNSDYSAGVTYELFSESYFYSVDNLLMHLKTIHNSKTSVENTDEYYDAQEAFNKFSDDVEVGKAYKVLYGQDEEWYSKLPNEEALLSIIKTQEEKAVLYPSYHIYNCLSNSYQTLALEYYRQNANKSTIKYFYLMSIKSDIKSIEYSTQKGELYAAIDRIITRYDDILLCCDYNDDEKRYLESLIESF